MNPILPDLTLCSRVAIDIESTGLEEHDKAVGLGLVSDAGHRVYLAWGHATGNNCSLDEVRQWADRELTPRLKKIFYNASFDARLLKSAGVRLNLDNVEDVSIVAPLLNELLTDFSLGGLATMHLGRGKLDDQALNSACAQIFGGRDTMKAQVQNYWRMPADQVADYCTTDAELTLELFDVLRPKIDEPNEYGHELSKVYALENSLIPILFKMHDVGVKVDVGKAERLQSWLDSQFQEAKIEWDAMTGGINPKSTPQMATLLEGLGIRVPYNAPTPKMIERGKLAGIPVEQIKGNPSVNKAFLEGIRHPIGDIARKMRTLSHYAGTFVNNYILENADADGFIHGQFHQLKREREYGGQTGTVSGRFSSSGGLNLQNLPAPDPEKPDSDKHKMASAVRGLFVPRNPDMQWACLDYSQIEFRFCAHYAGGALRRAYQENPDIDFHTMVKEITGIDRKPAKTINFGLAYGMGITLLSERLRVSMSDAKRMLDEYNARLPEVRQIYDRTMRRASQRGYIRTWGGRHRRFPEDPYHKYGKYGYTHKALNALLQGSAADLIKRAMVDVNSIIDWESVIMTLTVHDELDFDVVKGAAGDKKLREIVDVMESYSSEMSVPIKVDCEVGDNWGDVHKWEPKE